jgi:hypothetical protein
MPGWETPRHGIRWCEDADRAAEASAFHVSLDALGTQANDETEGT